VVKARSVSGSSRPFVDAAQVLCTTFIRFSDKTDHSGATWALSASSP
jgi:hypothetical protein